MSAIDEMLSKRRRSKEEAWPRYKEIIFKHNPTNAEIRELEEVVEILNLPPDTLRAHADAIRTWRYQGSPIIEAKGVWPRIDEANAKLLKHQEETKAIMAARTEAAKVIREEIARLEAIKENGNAASSKIHNLRKQFPDIFQDVKGPHED